MMVRTIFYRLPMCIGLSALAALAGAKPAVAQEWFLQMELKGQRVEGVPLFWDKDKFQLLERDGQIREYGMDLIGKTRRVREPFHEFSHAEMRGQLAREFRDGWQITATGNYLVVHPEGEADKWPPRFEQLYRELLVYFTTRGIAMSKPRFPLVAIVFHSQLEFMQYCGQHGGPVHPGILGFYDHRTNRIYLYDESAGGRYKTDWRHNAETIVHEAAHQTAFNMGLHTRFAETPRWLVEGLGTLFEAPGIYDAGHHPTLHERVNRGKLSSYRTGFEKGLPPGALTELLASDRIFQSSTAAAYTLSWALTFMLSETQPANYAEYLKLTSKKQPFVKDSASNRLRDFRQIFGDDLALTESRLHRYIMQLQ